MFAKRVGSDSITAYTYLYKFWPNRSVKVVEKILSIQDMSTRFGVIRGQKDIVTIKSVDLCVC